MRQGGHGTYLNIHVDAHKSGVGRGVALILVDPVEVGLQAGCATPQDPLGVSHECLHRYAAGCALLDKVPKIRVVYIGVDVQVRPLQALFLGKCEEL